MGSIPTIPTRNGGQVLGVGDWLAEPAPNPSPQPPIMKKPEISFDSIPSSAVFNISLKICLKCAFDVFTKQLKLTTRTAYGELKKHVPEEVDVTGQRRLDLTSLMIRGSTTVPIAAGQDAGSQSFTQSESTRILHSKRSARGFGPRSRSTRIDSRSGSPSELKCRSFRSGSSD